MRVLSLWAHAVARSVCNPLSLLDEPPKHAFTRSYLSKHNTATQQHSHEPSTPIPLHAKSSNESDQRWKSPNKRRRWRLAWLIASFHPADAVIDQCGWTFAAHASMMGHRVPFEATRIDYGPVVSWRVGRGWSNIERATWEWRVVGCWFVFCVGV